MKVLSSKPLERKVQRYTTGLLSVLCIASIIVLLLAASGKTGFSLGQARIESVSLALSVIGSLAASYVFGMAHAKNIDEEYRKSVWQEIRGLVEEALNKALPAYAPNGVYRISDEIDHRFHLALLADLRKSDRYFFSGFSGRVAMARLSLAEVGVIRKCVFRLPVSESSLSRALTIFHDVRASERHANPEAKRNNEFFGFEGDRTEFLEWVKGEDFALHRLYIKSVVQESILFAYYLMEQHHFSIDILDWDGLTESRVELLDGAVYIGNYHPLGEDCNFEPGTLRFSKGSFVWSFLNDGIAPQFELCNERPDEKRLRFLEKDTFAEAKAKLEKFSEDTEFISAFSSKLAADHFRAFITCAYPRKNETLDKDGSANASTSAGQN